MHSARFAVAVSTYCLTENQACLMMCKQDVFRSFNESCKMLCTKISDVIQFSLHKVLYKNYYCSLQQNSCSFYVGKSRQAWFSKKGIFKVRVAAVNGA